MTKQRPWTRTDDQLLRMTADQGVMALCYLLKRTPGSIRDRARTLRIPIVEPRYTTSGRPSRVPEDWYDLVELYGSDDAQICPRCGSGIIVPWSPAGLQGICPKCYMKARTDAEWDLLVQEELGRDYNKLKKRLQRAREMDGSNPRKGVGIVGASPHGPTRRVSQEAEGHP